MAKGARRPRKDGRGPFSLLDRCQVVFIKRSLSRLYVVTDWSVTGVFRRMRRDMESLYAAMFANELILSASGESEEDPKVFEWFESFLERLDAEGASPAARLVFESGLLNELGLAPELSRCALCGGRVCGAPRFSAPAGGALCEECGRTDHAATGLSMGAVAAMRRMARMAPGDRVRIALSPAQRAEIDRALKDHFEYQLGRPLRTARYVMT